MASLEGSSGLLILTFRQTLKFSFGLTMVIGGLGSGCREFGDSLGTPQPLWSSPVNGSNGEEEEAGGQRCCQAAHPSSCRGQARHGGAELIRGWR